MLIPDHVWAQLDPEQQELLRETIKGNRARSKTFVCPCCSATVQVSYSVELRAAQLPGETKKVVDMPPNRLPPDMHRLVEAARASGLLEHFGAAMREQNDQGPIKDVETMFCRYWKLVAPVHLTDRQRQLLIAPYGPTAEVWGAQGVWVVVTRGLVQAFIPQRFVGGAVGARRFGLSVEPQFDAWVKGPFGYVPASAKNFATALRQENFGKFGLLVQ